MKKLLESSLIVRLTLAISVIVIWATPTSANLIVNGSFEQGPGGYIILSPGSLAINGWVVTRADIDYSPGWVAADGIRCLDLDGSPGVGGVAQTFATVSNQQYLVTFALAANPDNGPRIETVGVGAAGQSAFFSFDNTGFSATNMGWATKSWTFTAVGASTTLEFYSTDTTNQNYGPALDKVSVEVVPEPTTISMLGLALLGVLAIRRKK